MKYSILSFLKKTMKRLLGKHKSYKFIERIYEEKDYLSAYSYHTDIRVDKDPHLAVGGHWEDLGNHQFNFLVENGIHPHHRMLDIGCGTLRGGRHFIKFFNAENYTGMDISSKAIEYGKKLVHRENLMDKKPRLSLSKINT